MRLLDAGRSAEQTADYFLELHELGIRTLHSSREYESFPLLTEVLSILARREPGRSFRHLTKLAEPTFDDDDDFSPERFSRRIDDYRRMLQVEMVNQVQWMWRRRLDEDSARLSDFRRNSEAISKAVKAEQARGSIGGVLCFPYSPAFALAALEQDWVDGLAVYRNAEEHEYDGAIEQADALGKAAIVIRPFFGGKLVAATDPADLLAAALDRPSIEAAILSTNSIAHMRALLC